MYRSHGSSISGWRRCAVCLLAFSSLTVQCHALDPQKNVTQYVQVALSDKDGLPRNSVYSIAQTNDGYLWFGTEEGIARFEGVRVTVMNTLKNKTLVDNYVNVLTAGRDGSLWIGTRSGVIRYKDEIFRTYFSPGSPINAILEDRSGRISGKNAAFRERCIPFPSLALSSDDGAISAAADRLASRDCSYNLPHSRRAWMACLRPGDLSRGGTPSLCRVDHSRTCVRPQDSPTYPHAPRSPSFFTLGAAVARVRSGVYGG